MKERISFKGMGTKIEIDVQAESKLKTERLLSGAKNIFEEQEKVFSRFDSESELSKLNESIGEAVLVSAEMLKVLEESLDFYEATEGYFDPRIIEALEKYGYAKSFFSDEFGKNINIDEKKEANSRPLREDIVLNKDEKKVLIKKRIDLTGIVKGFTVDRVSEYLKNSGCKNFLVDAGGDMFGSGVDEKGNCWIINVEGANENALFKLNDEGIATSGIGRRKWTQGEKRFHHLVNPKKQGEFLFDLRTVTVIALTTAEADVLAKTLFLMGKEKGLEFADKKNIKALFLDYKGNAYVSKAIEVNVVS